MDLETTCRRCHAQVKRAFLRAHNEWHATVEPQLEAPTSDFGFWGPDGRWNANSEDW